VTRSAPIRTLLFVIALAVAGCGREPAPFSATDIAANNKGVALMGYFDYPGARAVFAELVERRPDWLDARANLAIATLNRQEEGDEARALEIFAAVLDEAPDHPRARYMSGLLNLYLGNTAASLEHLYQVAEADPDDAYAAYFIGQNLLQEGRLDETLEWFRRAAEADPYLRSAYYGAGLAARRLGQGDVARDWLGQYQRLADNPRARLAEFKYTRMGPKGMALAVGTVPESLPADVPAGPLFAAPVDLAIGAWPLSPAPSLTTADVDGDGVQDLLLAGARTRVFRGVGAGAFEALPDHPLTGITDVIAAAWGDVDNDGHTDVYLCRRGANELRLRTVAGWRDATAEAGVGDAGACVDTAMIDADHDGDLDLFVVNVDGPDELFNNDRTGRFRRLAAERGIAGGAGGRQFVAADLDADRDLDLVVLNDGREHDVWLNDRLWSYRPAPGMDDFRAADLVAAVAADADADGQVELHTLARDGGLSTWTPDEAGDWSASSRGRVRGQGGFEDGWLTLTDLDGDGRLERLAGAAGGFGLPDGRELAGADAGLASAAVPVLVEPAQGPALVALAGSGDAARLRYWGAGAGRHPFLALRLSGKENQADSMRSNRDAIGARVSLRNLDRWSVAWLLDTHSAPGQSSQPLAIGLAGRGQADYVAIDWSDGVFQTELGLAAGDTHLLAETQRQLSSCPVLFAWDGERYAFVSDLLGVGGLGFLVAPGRYAEPRPWEYFLLPEGSLAARDGRYVLKIAEPMEENAYLDALRLHVTDLPPGWDLVRDERMATGAPAVTGRPIYFREEMLPARVTGAGGADVSRALRHADRVAAPAGPPDPRFIGRLREPQVVTLEFDEAVNPPATRPVLVADGWVEYPYSQTVFSAWQAGASYDPATLEARDRDGAWHTVHEHFGYPAGMPRRMALPLTALPPATVALRLTSNLELYWDRLAIVYEEDPPAGLVSVSKLPVRARLAQTGFPLRTTGPQRLPAYDYERRQAFWDARYLEGAYTRFGPVEELVTAADDAVVVMGSGEEVHLEFAAPPAPPQGWKRRLVLEARGWAKDMDLYTRDGGRVGPLPRTRDGDPSEEARRTALHDRYNLRFQGGR
jgi:Flp pilus assembly protein TadD